MDWEDETGLYVLGYITYTGNISLVSNNVILRCKTAISCL
jgi:hypothetical protein